MEAQAPQPLELWHLSLSSSSASFGQVELANIQRPPIWQKIFAKATEAANELTSGDTPINGQTNCFSSCRPDACEKFSMPFRPKPHSPSDP